MDWKLLFADNMIAYIKYRRRIRTSIAVQWLRIHAFTTGGTGSTPGWGTKILCAVQNGQKNKKEFIDKLLESISELNKQNEARNVLFVDLDADHISWKFIKLMILNVLIC